MKKAQTKPAGETRKITLTAKTQQDFTRDFASPEFHARRAPRPYLIRALELHLSKREPTPKRKHGNIPL